MQYVTHSASEDIVLFDGQLSLAPNDQGEPITAEGRVWFRWEPSPRPYFGLHSNDPRLLFERDQATLTLHPDDIVLVTENVSLGGAGEFPGHGPIEPATIGNANASLASVTFHSPTSPTSPAGHSVPPFRQEDSRMDFTKITISPL